MDRWRAGQRTQQGEQMSWGFSKHPSTPWVTVTIIKGTDGAAAMHQALARLPGRFWGIAVPGHRAWDASDSWPRSPARPLWVWKPPSCLCEHLRLPGNLSSTPSACSPHPASPPHPCLSVCSSVHPAACDGHSATRQKPGRSHTEERAACGGRTGPVPAVVCA